MSLKNDYIVAINKGKEKNILQCGQCVSDKSVNQGHYVVTIDGSWMTTAEPSKITSRKA